MISWCRPGPGPAPSPSRAGIYHFEYVNVWPRPYQQPHPPIWCPSLGSTETVEWASHPSRRYVYIQNFSPVAVGDALSQSLSPDGGAHARLYRELGADRLGGADLCRRDRRAGASTRRRPHIEALFNKYLTLPFEMLFPPGYLSRAAR